ncbi:short-chain dehydrogenase/reductase SDR [Candidatus Koribacter versatilis Ellin345]|uniref:Short-chain dehydrogenase/reductase SDR n=1 Tax=Koribacter versatilis (strain Ellin345) TaxID=204669 RepID=Q1IVR9_KORVE|nr:glucose 1-dehydrogenase [Candidatus Koribacter versatilis]ABF39031.1 short-chain dehydrogenase/reductase SDR [Candidatus Koribacter versatilis Ellin345]
MGKLSGKVAVVTGASKGIGAAIAKTLAGEGASVVVNYASSKAGADKVVNEIQKAGGKAVAIHADLSKPEDAKKLAAETKKQFGKVDILVNNAGVYEFRPLELIDETHVKKIFDLNVTGLLFTTQEFVKLIPEEGGSIINISSVVAKTPPSGSAVYSATKGAVDVISRVLAQELGPKKIRVNSLSPGFTITEGVQASGYEEDLSKSSVLRTPLGRVGQPDDIAKVALFLASGDSGWVTGETILAGGGIRV